MQKIGCQKGGIRESSDVDGVRDDGSLDQSVSIGDGKKWSDSRQLAGREISLKGKLGAQFWMCQIGNAYQSVKQGTDQEAGLKSV